MPDLKAAVIPTAGYGTRMYPLTKAIPKAFLPVIGADGLARPAILHLVDEALSAGVERVIVVASPAHQPELETYFHTPTPPEIYQRLKPPQQAEADRLAALQNRVIFATQPEPLGFGHAVYCAREAVSTDAFILMLGDHVFVSSVEESCAAQLAATYHQHRQAVMALQTITREELHHNGVVGGAWVDEGRVLALDQMLEKPDPATAQPLRLDGRYFAALGQYILTPYVFDLLDRQISEGQTQYGEYQMTTALHALATEGRLYGLITQGETFDIGHPARFIAAVKGSPAAQ